MKRGFTLVELAVVMTIIGLLIGGILKGQELVENGRITSTMSQMKAFEAAFNGFRDKYAAIPGDYPKAVGGLGACTDNTICRNGNGNGWVGTGLPTFNTGFAAVWTDETMQAWNHLYLANFIKGVKTSNTAASFGETNPKGEIGGGYLLATVNQPEDYAGSETSAGATGVFVLLRNSPTGANGCSGAVASCVLTPTRAAQIDRKLDDGVAFKGIFRTYSGASGGCGWEATNGPGGYDETKVEKVCDAAYQIGS